LCRERTNKFARAQQKARRRAYNSRSSNSNGSGLDLPNTNRRNLAYISDLTSKTILLEPPPSAQRAPNCFVAKPRIANFCRFGGDPARQSSGDFSRRNTPPLAIASQKKQ